ncbi:ABC transporter permease [Brenneria corticis]|uniref:ABC transmembrane type-1 domain-containing protein n=1 Tax=Brenneria corticis TaxID=2173106 RepID=A0A2U1UD49_9GAMM|nr:ABC transporter permease [Brenneria sp. CFCC 11842]PWC19537.1 hypothetical protein DDT56_00760 [Brenneria sp. CFCC 11842]
MDHTQTESVHIEPPKKRRVKRRYEGFIAIILLIVVWETAAQYLPPILFPSLTEVAVRFIQMFHDDVLIHTTLLTYARILVAVIFSFIVCSAAGILAGLYAPVDHFLSPLIQIKQGVPSLCWIIFSIIWFKDVEIRNVFIVFISTLPSLYYLSRDGVRAIPTDLWEMVRAWRPTRLQLIFKLLLPSILPNLVTGLRVNIGTGARVVVFAELLGGVSGVGYQLRIAEEQFLMDQVLAWTVVLVFWILVCDNLLKIFENKMLRARGSKG